jgi:hypothetical protein
MGVAARLGVGDLGSPLMEAACHAWPRWCAADPKLAVVKELAELPEWMCHASGQQKNDVLSRLAALTEHDSLAEAAMAWLLVPGASRIANELGDLHRDIDGLVAGQLWIEVSRSHELSGRRIAGTILRRTRREVCAELGIGDRARRRDRVWAESIRVEDTSELGVAADGYESQDELFEQVTELMIDAMNAKAINSFDAWLLGQLANLATQMGVAGSRGRMGLTTPAVVDEVAGMVHLSARAIRRRATTALDRFAEYVRVRESPERFAVWKAQHTSCPVTPAEEMQLVLTEDCDPHFFRVRDLPPDGWAPDVAPERRRPAIG